MFATSAAAHSPSGSASTSAHPLCHAPPTAEGTRERACLSQAVEDLKLDVDLNPERKALPSEPLPRCMFAISFEPLTKSIFTILCKTLKVLYVLLV